MDKIITYATIVIAVLSVFITIINFITSKIKIRRKSKDSTETIEELETDLKSTKGFNQLITKIIPEAIEFVEKQGVVGSELKEMLALSKIMINCQNEQIAFDESFIKDAITKLVDFTKKINVKEKDHATSEHELSQVGIESPISPEDDLIAAKKAAIDALLGK